MERIADMYTRVYPEWGLLVQMVMKNCVVELSKGVAVAFSSTKVVFNAG